MDTPELLFEALGSLGFGAAESTGKPAPDVFLKRPNSLLQDAILHFLYVAHKGAKGKQVASVTAQTPSRTSQPASHSQYHLAVQEMGVLWPVDSSTRKEFREVWPLSQA